MEVVFVYSLQPSDAVVFGRFTHKVPEFILHKAAGSQNRMKLLPPKKDAANKEIDDGSESRKGRIVGNK